MLNANWYLKCNVQTRAVEDFMQIPAVLGNVTGLLEQSDDDLRNFFLWSPHTEISFLQVDRARSEGYDEASIQNALTVAQPALLSWARSMRDPILAASDAITVPDRWKTLDAVAQNYITAYRQALRDLTNGDLLNLVWPAIPPQLDFLRTFDVMQIERPSSGFLNMLTAPFPAPSLDEARNNQVLRIKALRDTRAADGVMVAVNGTNYWFWTDAATLNQYSIMASTAIRKQLTDDAVLANMKTMSGAFVSFTVALLHQVIDTGTDNVNTIYTVAEQHIQNVMTSSDPDNYNYSTGWPQTYQEYVASA